MRISLNHRLVVLGNRKCGSTTLDRYFRKVTEPLDEQCFSQHGSPRLITGYADFTFSEGTQSVLDRTLPKHYDAFQYRRLFDEIDVDWEPLRKLVSIRNPWARAVSTYKWDKTRGRKFDVKCNPQAFEDFLMTFQRFGRIPLEHFTGVYGGDYAGANFTVVRLEDFAAQLPAIWQDLGLPKRPPKAVPIANRRITKANQPLGPANTPNYVAWYTDLSRDFIQSLFREDIRVGRYEFGV